MHIVIDIPEELYEKQLSNDWSGNIYIHDAIVNGTPLPKGHGRIGDLDELERRISDFVEHDAKITDDYIVTRQRFIVDGIRDTPTIIETDKGE